MNYRQPRKHTHTYTHLFKCTAINENSGQIFEREKAEVPGRVFREEFWHSSYKTVKKKASSTFKNNMFYRYARLNSTHYAIQVFSCTSHLHVVSKAQRLAGVQSAIPLSRLGKLIVMVNLHCIWNHLGDRALAFLWRCFHRGLTEEGRHTLKVGSTIPWARISTQR